MNYFEKEKVYDTFFIDDYVSYIEADKVIGSNSFRIIGLEQNSMGQIIMILDKPLTVISIYSSSPTSYKAVHPCYLQLSEKGIRKRKLKKINGTSD